MSTDLVEKVFSDKRFMVWKCADRNGSESADSRVAGADYRQLIDSETMLVSRTSGDRLSIIRFSVHCGACAGGFVKNCCRCHVTITQVLY